MLTALNYRKINIHTVLALHPLKKSNCLTNFPHSTSKQKSFPHSVLFTFSFYFVCFCIFTFTLTPKIFSTFSFQTARVNFNEDTETTPPTSCYKEKIMSGSKNRVLPKVFEWKLSQLRAFEGLKIFRLVKLRLFRGWTKNKAFRVLFEIRYQNFYIFNLLKVQGTKKYISIIFQQQNFYVNILKLLLQQKNYIWSQFKYRKNNNLFWSSTPFLFLFFKFIRPAFMFMFARHHQTAWNLQFTLHSHNIAFLV